MDDIPATLEAFPVEYTAPLFRCPKGHEQRGSGETTATFWQAHGKATVSSGPVCVECWLTKHGQLYPTLEVGK